jgi:hypothetical protein
MVSGPSKRPPGRPAVRLRVLLLRREEVVARRTGGWRWLGRGSPLAMASSRSLLTAALLASRFCLAVVRSRPASAPSTAFCAASMSILASCLQVAPCGRWAPCMGWPVPGPAAMPGMAGEVAAIMNMESSGAAGWLLVLGMGMSCGQGSTAGGGGGPGPRGGGGGG